MINIKYPNENQVVFRQKCLYKNSHELFILFKHFFFRFKQIKKNWGGRFFIGVGGDENLKIYLVWPK